MTTVERRARIGEPWDASRPGTRPSGPAVRTRHVGDVARVGLGIAVLGLSFLAARQGRLSLFERDVFRLVNDLPQLLFPVVWAVMQLGNVVAVPVLALLAAGWRRMRMAGDLMIAMSRDLAVAGTAAYFLARYIKDAVGRGRPADFPVGAILHEPPLHGLGFVSGHAAVAAALATAAAPYLTRRGRRIAWTLAWAVAVSRVYMGAHLPLDVVGGLALGWVLGSALHLLVGVPRWTPAAAHVSALLTRLGVPHRELRPAAVAARSSHPFVATGTDGGELFVKVLDPDPLDEDWVYRLARLLAVRDVKDTDALSSLGHQAEHEAAVTLAARHHGVRAPVVVLARRAEGRALLVQERIPGVSVDVMAPAAVPPDLLRGIWRQVAVLRRARIAHRDLVDASVVIDAHGLPWLVDFGNAEVGADDHALAADVAELLASLSVRLPPADVVAAAVRVLGPAPIREALPLLQPLAVSAATRARLRTEPGRLDEVRREVLTQLTLPPAEAPGLRSAGPLSRLLVATGAAAVLLGLPLAAGGSAVLGAPQPGWWRWLGLAAVAVLAGRLAVAGGTLAVVDRRLALGRIVMAHAVATGAALLRGRPGSRAAGLQYLRRSGLSEREATEALGRVGRALRWAGVAVATVAVIVAAVRGSVGAWEIPSLPAVVVVAAGAGAVLIAWGQIFGRVARPAAAIPPDAAAGSPQPRTRSAALAAGAGLAAAADGLAFAAVLDGVGADVPVLVVAALAILAPLLWSALPPAGGAGAVELLLLAGLVALGVPIATACAGVLLHRLLTWWLPAGIGALTAAHLQHRLVL